MGDPTFELTGGDEIYSDAVAADIVVLLQPRAAYELQNPTDAGTLLLDPRGSLARTEGIDIP